MAADGGDPGGLADQALLLPWEQRSRNRWVEPNAALLSHVHMYVHAVDFFKYGGSRLLLGWVHALVFCHAFGTMHTTQLSWHKSFGLALASFVDGACCCYGVVSCKLA